MNKEPINKFCPNSGKRIKKDSLTEYKGFLVGFCNKDCRDEFAANSEKESKAKIYFDTLIREFKS